MLKMLFRWSASGLDFVEPQKWIFKNAFWRSESGVEFVEAQKWIFENAFWRPLSGAEFVETKTELQISKILHGDLGV